MKNHEYKVTEVHLKNTFKRKDDETIIGSFGKFIVFLVI